MEDKDAQYMAKYRAAEKIKRAARTALEKEYEDFFKVWMTATDRRPDQHNALDSPNRLSAAEIIAFEVYKIAKGN